MHGGGVTSIESLPGQTSYGQWTLAGDQTLTPLPSLATLWLTVHGLRSAYSNGRHVSRQSFAIQRITADETPQST